MKSSEYSRVVVVIPTFNGGDVWKQSLLAIVNQDIDHFSLLVVDSGSTDSTLDVARRSPAKVIEINKDAFDHGRTRQLAVDVSGQSEILVFLTQDAVLFDQSTLSKLVDVFRDPTIDATYGRQLPRKEAGPIEAHARLFNYPDEGRTVSISDATELGIKTAFLSNSFAAYRRSSLVEVGGFPSKVLFGEDTIVAARMLIAGSKIAYCARAMVYHSHSYTPLQEFKRYFDIGALHAQEKWMLEELGRAESEGLRFLKSELIYLAEKAPLLIPIALVRTFLKYFGYRLGRMESLLPLVIKRALSMHPSFWT